MTDHRWLPVARLVLGVGMSRWSDDNRAQTNGLGRVYGLELLSAMVGMVELWVDVGHVADGERGSREDAKARRVLEVVDRCAEDALLNDECLCRRIEGRGIFRGEGFWNQAD
jgi:hypothetical protein